ncbi:HAMP domain-containing protein [Streptomyces sp. NA02950]|uniref:HAMP domain-containing protein n=1 Tax=Streptomyces sp. NA02950 TaxID=2742137 RepID=UPI001590CEE7|nr:HAMP domain-containing protein [Streptomyces sp. NA02950]QKV92060.1 HAMP domain-containing protein [Streptomyces sp. NA02950]
MPLLGGVRPPIAALGVFLLAVAGFTALTVGHSDDRGVSRAVAEAQQDVAADAAGSLRASLEQSSGDLRDATELLRLGDPGTPEEALRKLAGAYHKWRGLSVVDAATGRPLASHGEAVPPERPLVRHAGDRPRSRLVRLPSGESRVLSFAPLDAPDGGGRLLVASRALPVPDERAGRATFVVNTDGRILAASGDRNGDEPLRELARESGRARGATGSHTARGDRGHFAVVGHAAVPAGDGGQDFGLVVASGAQVPEGTAVGSDRWRGAGAAAALLAICLAVTWMLIRWIQRPVLRLHLDARRLAQGDLARPVARYGHGETARLGGSLESLRRQLLGEREETARSRARGSVRLTVLGCVVLVTSWSCALPLMNLAEGGEPVPAHVVRAQRDRTDAASGRVRRVLGEGAADLSSVALLAGHTPDGLGRALKAALPEHSAWRSLYLLGRDGEVLERAGGTPYDADRKAVLSRVKRGTPAVLQLNHRGRVPVSAAVVPVGGRALVAEFRPEVLSGALDRAHIGRAWLVDADDKVIGSNDGFIAFASLPGRPGDGATLTTAAPVRGTGAVNALRWRVVTHKPVSWLPLASYETQRRAEVAGLLAFGAAVLCLGWLELAVLRPLRALDRSAAALAAGDLQTVRYPRHHDEVGSVVRSLELIRQRLAAAEPSATGTPRPVVGQPR